LTAQVDSLSTFTRTFTWSATKTPQVGNRPIVIEVNAGNVAFEKIAAIVAGRADMVPAIRVVIAQEGRGAFLNMAIWVNAQS
jgi:hypothetical protein